MTNPSSVAPSSVGMQLAQERREGQFSTSPSLSPFSLQMPPKAVEFYHGRREKTLRNLEKIRVRASSSSSSSSPFCGTNGGGPLG